MEAPSGGYERDPVLHRQQVLLTRVRVEVLGGGRARRRHRPWDARTERAAEDEGRAGGDGDERDRGGSACRRSA